MVFIKRKKGNVLEQEPYTTFLRKYGRMSASGDEKIHMRIKSASDKAGSGFAAGFSLDYAYTKWFDLEFCFYTLVDEELSQEYKFCVVHTISFRFQDDAYSGIMMDTISDIQKRAGHFYISSLIRECEVSCSLSDKNTVNVAFAVACDKKNAREVCLQLISQDIALFARSF